jgi:hypothetical protein
MLPRGHKHDRSEEAHGQDTRQSGAHLGVPNLDLRDVLAGQRTLRVFSYACIDASHCRISLTALAVKR